MNRWFLLLPLVGLGVCLGLGLGLAPAAPALAQTKGGADQADSGDAPTESSLAVGALQIGSVPALQVASFIIAVAPNAVAYSYELKNTSTAAFSVAAAVSLPELQASADGSETWKLASNNAENFVNLAVTAAGNPVDTKAQVRANALGVDRTEELRTQHLPMIPFGSDTTNALAALPPEKVERLAALGIISPRDPAQPNAALTADWTLDVVHSFSLDLSPGKATPVTVKFVPVVSHYRVVKGDEQDLEEAQGEICLRAQVLAALQARLKSNGAWTVTDISVADDPPARWLESAPATITVQKPRTDAVVTFCGMDEKTAGKPTVLGTAPDDNNGIRIVIFEPAQ